MLEWLLKTHAETAKSLKETEVRACHFRGGLAALEAAIAEARKAQGGGSVAAPVPPVTPQTQTPLIQGVSQAVRIPHGPIQADQELRE